MKSNFGGGNTNWEEKSLGKWKTRYGLLIQTLLAAPGCFIQFDVSADFCDLLLVFALLYKVHGEFLGVCKAISPFMIKMFYFCPPEIHSKRSLFWRHMCLVLSFIKPGVLT